MVSCIWTAKRLDGQTTWSIVHGSWPAGVGAVTLTGLLLCVGRPAFWDAGDDRRAVRGLLLVVFADGRLQQILGQALVRLEQLVHDTKMARIPVPAHQPELRDGDDLHRSVELRHQRIEQALVHLEGELSLPPRHAVRIVGPHFDD